MDKMIIHCLYDQLSSVSELVPHPKNRNSHPPDQIKRLAEILKYQGWRYPVKVSKRSGLITSGHGRLEAAKLNKWKEVPVNFQDYESDEQEYADLQADNAIASWAELDLSGVNTDIGDLGPDFNIDLLGIRDFVIEPLDKLDPMCDEDEVPEHVEPRTKLGDIYLLGNHRLMCGSSDDMSSVDTLMGKERALMVLTDPPYGVSYQSNFRTKTAKFDVLKNDETFLSDWIQCLPVVSEGWVFIWTTWKVMDRWLEITKPLGELSNVIIWYKPGGYMGDLEKTFGTDYEMALVYHRGATIQGTRLGSVWKIGKDFSGSYLHPTQKPVELSVLAIEQCTQPKNIVLDLFGGSGSTLIACEKTARHCRMMELDPKYCDVIVARWEKYTGKKAELVDG